MSADPQSRPTPSLKAFGREFLMIVVSITTALALEQTVSTLRHRRAGEISRRQILQEIRANLAETRKVNLLNQESSKVLAAAAEALFKDIKAGVPAGQINDAFLARYHGMPVGLRLPTLRREAWEVAVANQAVSYIDEAVLRRYSAAYACQRDLHSSFGSAIEVVNLPGLVNITTELMLRRAEPVELLRTLGRAQATCDLVGENLGELARQLEVSSQE